jgi:hypothetical protein
MDLLIATNSVPFSSADVAPGSGTPQYGTNGNPIGPIPATVFPAYMLNMIMSEIRNAVLASGQTPDGTNWSQLANALGLFPPTGQCRLTVTNSTTITMMPWGGNRLRINGISQPIPSAGVTLSNTGLSASTLYYIYASMSGSTMQLQASTTGHALATDGTEVKSGDTTQALVGMCYPAAGTPGVFSFAVGWRGLLNWFNRRGINANSAIQSGFSTSSLTLVELYSAARVTFLNWSSETVRFDVVGTGSNSGVGGFELNFGLDSTTVGSGSIGVGTSAAANQIGTAVSIGFGATEGAHFATMLGAAVTTGTATFTAGLYVTTNG